MTQGFLGPALTFVDCLYAGHEDTLMYENDAQVGCRTDLVFSMSEKSRT